MRDVNDVDTSTRRTTRKFQAFVCALALAILAVQTVAQSHVHPAGEADTLCEFCLQADHDAVSVQAQRHETLPNPTASVSTAVQEAQTRTRPLAHPPRAPPYS